MRRVTFQQHFIITQKKNEIVDLSCELAPFDWTHHTLMNPIMDKREEEY